VFFFFRASIGHCLCVFFVAKSAVQRFMFVFVLLIAPHAKISSQSTSKQNSETSLILGSNIIG